MIAIVIGDVLELLPFPKNDAINHNFTIEEDPNMNDHFLGVISEFLYLDNFTVFSFSFFFLKKKKLVCDRQAFFIF